MISNEELAMNMIRFRAKNGITQEDMAKKVGISFSTLNQIENLKSSPTKTTKMKIVIFMEDYSNDMESNN